MGRTIVQHIAPVAPFDDEFTFVVIVNDVSSAIALVTVPCASLNRICLPADNNYVYCDYDGGDCEWIQGEEA